MLGDDNDLLGEIYAGHVTRIEFIFHLNKSSFIVSATR